MEKKNEENPKGLTFFPYCPMLSLSQGFQYFQVYQYFTIYRW